MFEQPASLSQTFMHTSGSTQAISSAATKHDVTQLPLPRCEQRLPVYRMRAIIPGMTRINIGRILRYPAKIVPPFA